MATAWLQQGTVTVPCPACHGAGGVCPTGCLGSGRVEVLAELLAIPGAIDRWWHGLVADATAGRPPMAARVLPGRRVVHGTDQGVPLDALTTPTTTLPARRQLRLVAGG